MNTTNSAIGRRGQRGSALVGALTLTLIASALIGASLTYTTTHRRNMQARTDSEAALLLAEAGVTSELQRMNTRFNQVAPSAIASTPTQATGAPYKGREGAIEDVPGKYWVYASTTPQGTTPWPGYGPLYVTAQAVVNGATRSVTIGGNKMGTSIFADYALFGNSPATSGGSVAFGMTGKNNVINVEGAVGTNGGVRGSNYTLNFTMAVSYQGSTTRSGSFSGGSTYTSPGFHYLPTVQEVAETTFGLGSGSSAATYLAANNDNGSGVRQWNKGLSSGAELTAANTSAVALPSGGTFSNKQGGKLGAWENLNPKPGSSTVRTLILTPGDYFFEAADLRMNPDTELLVDNAGLTIGGNPTKRQIRIWILGNGSTDQIQIPIKVTDSTDASTFRLYYGKAGGRLTIERQSSMSGTLEVTGCIYGVNKKVDSTSGSGTQIDLFGDTAQSKLMVIRGSVMADMVTFNGFVDILHPGTAILNPSDPMSGVGFSGEYYQD